MTAIVALHFVAVFAAAVAARLCIVLALVAAFALPAALLGTVFAGVGRLQHKHV
jgi:hypothetical protein